MTHQPLDLFWFLPTSGDGSYLGTEKGHRPADIGYLRDIALADPAKHWEWLVWCAAGTWPSNG